MKKISILLFLLGSNLAAMEKEFKSSLVSGDCGIMDSKFIDKGLLKIRERNFAITFNKACEKRLEEERITRVKNHIKKMKETKKLEKSPDLRRDALMNCVEKAKREAQEKELEKRMAEIEKVMSEILYEFDESEESSDESLSDSEESYEKIGVDLFDDVVVI